MKAFKRKSILYLCMICCLMLSIPSQAFAATSVSGNIGGVNVSGNLSMGTAIGTQSASAYTSMGSAAGYITVSVTYHYKFGNVERDAYGSDYNSYGMYVSATAYADYAPAVPMSASGTHYVSYDKYTWSNSTHT